MSHPSHLMTVREAAGLLQLTPERVRQLADDGRIRIAGYAGRMRLLDRASVEHLAAARAVDPPRRGRPKGPA